MNYTIQNHGPISAIFLQQQMTTFSQACAWIKSLPYRRNSHKRNALVVLEEGCGTCSTKHALLQTLAIENEFHNVKLILGIYRMHAGNAPAIALILENHGLSYLPEAHYYLRINGKIHDYTFPDFEIPRLEEELLWEIEVGPHIIGSAKDALHRSFLEN